MHRITALPLAGLALLALAGCGGVTSTSLSDVSTGDTASDAHVVVIDGAGTALVSLDQDGAASQETGVTLPHHITIQPGVRVVAVSAQLDGQDAGSGISCSITDLDNTVLKEAHSSGDGAVASCAVALQ